MKNSTTLLIVFMMVILTACKNDKSAQTSTQINLDSQVNWMTLEQVEKANAKEKRDLYVMVHAPWCPKCEKFNNTTYKDPKVIKELNTYYYPVMLNAQESKEIMWKGKTYYNPQYDNNKSYEDRNTYHEIVFELGAKSIPSVVWINKNLEISGSEMGYKEAGELRSLMRLYSDF